MDSAWIEFVVDLLAEPLRELPREKIARFLMLTFDSEGCAFSSYSTTNVDAAMWPPEFWGGPPAYDHARLAAQESTHSHPIVQYLQAAGTLRATQIADVPNRFHADWQARGLDSYYRSVGVPHHLSLPLLGPIGSHQAFVLGRSARFTDREMTAAHTVQRLLAGLDRQAAALRQAAPELAATSDFGLTPREIAVLGLLAEGLTAATIGRRLLISRGTVNKHLHNLYPKLGVSDRLSAVRVSDRHGLLRSRNTHM